MLKFPPHARGWTLDRLHRSVSPGQGMDRDRRTFPPHARGWTPTSMSEFEPRRWISFPRTRGDGPRSPANPTDVRMQRFPRTRGDGPVTGYGHQRGRRDVSPARAGMDPDESCTTSGDAGHVSPARAGMDPIRRRLTRLHWRFPRTRGFPRTRYVGFPTPRGEDSALEPTKTLRIKFPPHARGWTREHPREQAVLRHSFPPHARGWTALQPPWPMPPRRDAVSPARAGMDPSRYVHVSG